MTQTTVISLIHYMNPLYHLNIYEWRIICYIIKELLGHFIYQYQKCLVIYFTVIHKWDYVYYLDDMY